MSTLSLTPGFSTARRPATRSLPNAGSSVHLTRRGRVVITLAMLAIVLAALTVFGARSAATDEPGTPVPTRVVQVGAGDTLWEIASEVAEPGQVREMIHQIQELNALSGAGLVQGQQIAVPIG